MYLVRVGAFHIEIRRDKANGDMEELAWYLMFVDLISD
jgi:hypothetical protein